MPKDPLRYLKAMQEAAEYAVEARHSVACPGDVAAFLRPLTAELEQEVVYVLLCDARNKLISFYEVSRGTVDSAQVTARDVFREAVRGNASRVVIAHNHPSGDVTPSSHDISLTRQLVDAGHVLGISVLDHVIVGQKTESRDKDWLSFREEGLIAEFNNKGEDK